MIRRDHEANAVPPVERALGEEVAEAESDVLRFSLADVQLKFSAGGTPQFAQ